MVNFIRYPTQARSLVPMLVAMEARHASHLAHAQLTCELVERRLVRLEWWAIACKEATRSECIFPIWIGQGQKEGPVNLTRNGESPQAPCNKR